MARTFTAASNDRLELAEALVTAVPLTFVAWVKLLAVGAVNRAIIEIRDKDSGADTHRWTLYMSNAEAISAGTAAALGTAASAAPITMQVGRWYHAAAVFSTDSLRTAYCNGVPGTPNTSTRAPLNVDYTMIGCSIHSTSTYQIPWGGEIADAAIYAGALSAAEIRQLYVSQAPPPSVRENDLKSYVPLAGRGATVERDVYGNRDFTVTGATAEAQQIIRPRLVHARYGKVPAAAGTFTPMAGGRFSLAGERGLAA